VAGHHAVHAQIDRQGHELLEGLDFLQNLLDSHDHVLVECIVLTFEVLLALVQRLLLVGNLFVYFFPVQLVKLTRFPADHIALPVTDRDPGAFEELEYLGSTPKLEGFLVVISHVLSEESFLVVLALGLCYHNLQVLLLLSEASGPVLVLSRVLLGDEGDFDEFYHVLDVVLKVSLLVLHGVVELDRQSV